MPREEVYLKMRCPPAPTFILAGTNKIQPGEMHPRRTFPAFVIMFIVRGVVYLTENGYSYEIPKGRWFIEIPGRFHYGTQPDTEPAEYYWIHFMPGGNWSLESTKDSKAFMNFNVNLFHNGKGMFPPDYEVMLPLEHEFSVETWKPLLDQICHDKRFMQWEGFYKQGLFTHLLSRMALEDNTLLFNKKDTLAKAVVDYIKNNYTANIKVKDLADHFHYSADHIARCIRQEFGQTPKEMLEILRLSKAKELLVNTDKSIEKVGRESGYTDLISFSKSFRKIEGMSPTKYRHIHVNMQIPS